MQNLFPRMTDRWDWMLPRISDYWDEQVQAIDQLSRLLAAVPLGAQWDNQVALIRAAIVRHVSALSDVDLTRAAFAVADDLYKALDRLSYIDHALFTYLWASAGSFFEELHARGYLLTYVIDNSFEDLTRPIRWYPSCYCAAGLFYICPQHIAYGYLLDAPPAEWQEPLDPARLDLVPSCISEAEELASESIRECYDKGRHFVLLATDDHEARLSAALKASGHHRVIRVFRREPPVPGSRCEVSFPN